MIREYPIVLKTVHGRKEALVRQIRADLVALNRVYEILPGHEEIETTLCQDLDWLVQQDIAEEIKLAFYNPIDSTDIFLEKKYRLGLFNTTARAGEVSQDLDQWRLPDSYEFDVFVYFKKSFLALNSQEQGRRLSRFHFGWFDLESFSTDLPDSLPSAVSIQPSAVSSQPSAVSSQLSVKKHEASHSMTGPFTSENGKSLLIASYTDSRKLIGEFIQTAATLGLAPVQWTYSEGLKPLGATGASAIPDFASSYTYDDRLFSSQKRVSPWDLLGTIRNECQNGHRKNTLYLLEDFHYYLTRENLSGQEFAEMISMIKSVPEPLKRAGSFLVILAPSLDLPPEVAPIFDTIKGESRLKSTQLLERYGRDLTKLVLEKKIKPVVGRDSEIRECLKILSRLEGNNPLLVGKAGVGKTAIVEGLAIQIVRNEVPPAFRNKRLIALNLNAVISGTKYRGEFEKRLEGLLEEVMSNAESIIVFIDEIHTLLGMGSTEGSAGAENILKPYLARGEFPCIGATTYDEYKKHIEPDRALVRRFQVVDIAEPNASQTVDILMGIKNIYESHHRVKISNDAVVKCVEAAGMLTQQYFPGKAIKLLDSVCASVSFAGKDSVTPESVVTEFKRLSQ
ncbi:AAA family ATPase [Bdellovibrionota bacterium FG-1]